MTLDDLRKTKTASLPENAHLFMGGAEKPLAKRDAPCALDGIRTPRQGGAAGVVISLVRFGRRPLDSDNLAGSQKHLRDAIAASLGIDDGDSRIRWECGQIETRGQQGVMVKIENL